MHGHASVKLHHYIGKVEVGCDRIVTFLHIYTSSTLWLQIITTSWQHKKTQPAHPPCEVLQCHPRWRDIYRMRGVNCCVHYCELLFLAVVRKQMTEKNVNSHNYNYVFRFHSLYKGGTATKQKIQVLWQKYHNALRQPVLMIKCTFLAVYGLHIVKLPHWRASVYSLVTL